MSRNLFPVSLIGALLAGTAMAEVPQVAVDIAPIHSLVAQVMQGVGVPSLVMPPGASPHQYSLRPSEAAALENADLVFWVGPELTPWMEGAVGTLAEDADVTTLLNLDGVTRLAMRETALFEAHAHGADDHDHDHEHDAAADGHDHDHEEHAEAGEHDDDHDHGHGGGHGASDPHAWLLPANAAAWLDVIAAKLSAADPGNAGAYFANAAAAKADLQTLSDEVNAILDPARGQRFIVFHDAYQYFETAFDFPSSGSISISDAVNPSPARIAEIQRRVADEDIGCVLSEPQFNAGLVATVMDGTAANTAVLDPLGSNLEPGPDLYPLLLRNLATTLADCL